jgi:hypothetical protein
VTPFTASKFAYVAALIAFIVAAILCFVSSDVTNIHIIGVIAIGLACVALAPLVA